MRCILIISLLLSCLGGEGWAQWDVSALRTLGGECFIADRAVDESKLTLKFSRFSASLDSFGVSLLVDEADCTAGVQFKVPPRRKLNSLTHRVFAYANKNESASIALDVVLSLDTHPFGIHGQLPSGSSFNNTVLLYKSFDAGSLYECSDEPRTVDVAMNWKLRVKSHGDNGRATLNLSGDDLWTDSWIETMPCDSTTTFALSDDALR